MQVTVIIKQDIPNNTLGIEVLTCLIWAYHNILRSTVTWHRDWRKRALSILGRRPMDVDGHDINLHPQSGQLNVLVIKENYITQKWDKVKMKCDMFPSEFINPSCISGRQILGRLYFNIHVGIDLSNSEIENSIASSYLFSHPSVISPLTNEQRMVDRDPC